MRPVVLNIKVVSVLRFAETVTSLLNANINLIIYIYIYIYIHSKVCLKRPPYIPETWTNGK